MFDGEMKEAAGRLCLSVTRGGVMFPQLCSRLLLSLLLLQLLFVVGKQNNGLLLPPSGVEGGLKKTKSDQTQESELKVT